MTLLPPRATPRLLPTSAGVLEQIEAPVNIAVAAATARRCYGLEATIAPLPGERDQNFLLGAADVSRYVLKFSHSAEDPAVIEFEIALQRHVSSRDPSLPIPRVLPTIDGALISQVNLDGHPPRRVRLFTHLHGEQMGARPRQAAAFHALGGTLARLHAALADFAHPAESRTLQWDLQRTLELRPRLPAVEDVRLRDLCREALDAFEERALPKLRSLPRQVIHNDLNPSNILFDPEAPDRLLGLLDFGDALRAPRVQDLAVAASYVLPAGADAAVNLQTLIRGYAAAAALSVTERQLLPDLVLARFAMTTIITAWRATLHPGNATYILRNAPAAHAGLRAFDSISTAMQCELLT